MAGYSKTPLAKKLGLRPDARVALLGAPAGFDRHLVPLPDGVRLSRSARGSKDVIVLFSKRAAELARKLPAARKALNEAGGLWVAWPKKSAGVATDLDFDGVQRSGLALGLVDNKVCAIDETWSGLRFVVRLADRRARKP
jgi:hypothetical protein